MDQSVFALNVYDCILDGLLKQERNKLTMPCMKLFSSLLWMLSRLAEIPLQ